MKIYEIELLKAISDNPEPLLVKGSMCRNKKPIDDDTVLNSYYDDRETFVVDYDKNLVSVEVNPGEVIFKLKVKG